MYLKLNDNQLKELADFTANLSPLFFGTVITPIFVAIDKMNPFMVILGLAFSIGSLLLSMFLLKGIR